MVDKVWDELGPIDVLVNNAGIILAQISMGRSGDPREIGRVVAFFASDDSSYLTGQSIHVDGGWVGK